MIFGEAGKGSPELLPGELGFVSTPKSKIFNSEAAVSSHADDVRNRVLSFIASTNKAYKQNKQSLVIEAIGAVGTDERGASLQAITKWILANYAIRDVEKLKIQIKRAILKALDEGTISRPQSSKNAMGAGGSFMLGKKTPRKPRKTKTVKEKRDSNSE